MRVLIVEDETAAYENLVDILGEVSYDIQIAGNTESVTQNHSLAAIESCTGFDIYGYSFIGTVRHLPFLIKWSWKLLLFSRRLMTDYAIEAFKVNSIDYLLKPVKVEDVKQALDKYKKLTRQDVIHYLSKLTQLVADS